MRLQFKHLILTFFVLLFSSAQLQAQKSKEILKSYKNGEDTFMFTVPGFVAKIAINSSTDVDQEVKKATKKVKAVRVFISENKNDKEYQTMVSELEQNFKKHDFKSLVQVKSDGDLIQIQFLPGTKKKRGEFVILAQSDSDFVAVVIEGNFSEQDVINLARNIDVESMHH